MALLPEHLPGERLLIKIWETVADHGIGGLLNPWQIKRVGRAHMAVRREEIQMLAQAHRDAVEISAGRKMLNESGRVIDRKPTELPSVPAGTTLPAPLLLQRLRHEQDRRGLERAINIRETIAMAENEASSIADESVSEKPVDPDWFTRWRANAEEIQDDEMRRLWARILTGEAQKPGRFSLHTLDFMRRLSKQDAAIITKVAPFVSGRDLFCKHQALEDLLASRRLGVAERMELQYLGVMSGVDGLLRKEWSIDREDSLRFRNKALVVCSSNAKTVTLGLNGITTVEAADNDFVLAVGQVILEQGFEVFVGNCQAVNDSNWRVVDARPLARPG
jgi:hypothetical protein